MTPKPSKVFFATLVVALLIVTFSLTFLLAEAGR